MLLTTNQRAFLASEFGIDNFNPILMTSLELWKLREDLIELECDEDLEDQQRDEAAYLVDYISKLLPEDWRRKTPPEVEAMLSVSQVIAAQQTEVVAV